jgi:hypothetical protein
VGVAKVAKGLKGIGFGDSITLGVQPNSRRSHEVTYYFGDGKSGPDIEIMFSLLSFKEDLQWPEIRQKFGANASQRNAE